MAVAISQTANPAGVAASSNVATYSGVSIGAAAEDRIIVVHVTSELATSGPSSVTIDYGDGRGALAMTPGSAGNFGNIFTRSYRRVVPTGTTADIVVTYNANPGSTENHISVYRVVGANPVPTAGGNSSTDMDATAPLTTGSITIATNGGFLAVAAGATDTVAKTWADATEDIDDDVGVFRHTTATRTTSGTVTITCTGGTNGEDGGMSWLIFTPGTLVVALAGSYTLTGTAATLRRGFIVSAAAGSYALTGSDATLVKAVAGKTLTADAGSYSLTGSSANLLRGRVVSAGAGSYALTGSTANLLYGRKVVAGSGSYALTGTDASLKYGRAVSAGAGSYALTGAAASLEFGRLVSAGAGAYTLTGTAASLKYGRVVSAGAGSYSFTGTAASLFYGRVVSAEAGSYSLTGTDASLIYAPAGAKILAAGAGSYSLTGFSAGLILSRKVTAEAGSYSLTGTDASLVYSAVPQPTVARGGGWLEPKQVEKARKKAEREKREAWKRLEDDIADAYADATGQPRKKVKPVVSEALAARDPEAVRRLAEKLAVSADPEAVRLTQRIDERLAEIEQLAGLIAEIERQAIIARMIDEDEAIAVLLMVN